MDALGLDLSTDPRKAWWCELHWPDGAERASIVDLGQAQELGARGDASLANVLAERLVAFAPGPGRIAGIDAPLGWPQAFVDAIRDWAHADRPRLTKRTELRLRPTDRFVQEITGLTPMSVSTDRIGSTALLCAHVLSELAERTGRGALDRARGQDGIVEVYPAAALRLWSASDGRPLTRAGYKTEPSVREELLEQLAEAVDLDAPGAELHVERMINSDDALDAMLCALVAGAVARGETFSVDAPVRAGDLVPPSTRVADPLAALDGRAERAEALRVSAVDLAEREGWIHVPHRSTFAPRTSPPTLQAAPAHTVDGDAAPAPAAHPTV